MALTIDDVIRHRLSNFYAVSLVDPVTFEVWAETQVKTAASRVKPITLHLDETNKNNTPAVELRDTSRIGFEWSFIWEGEKYRWYSSLFCYHCLCKILI
ncbi:hypothetical protein BD770DRAFT_312839 [Pilaira anomala]|nr:hypothetical protein BD770DRAFT_312839 [Pilaira anomala]